jgi:hypothetical protein
MENHKRSQGSALPPYLEICVRKGILDEQTAKRIELHRRTRGLGTYEAPFTLLTAPPDAHLTFDNFVTCKGNSFAVELAQTVASKSPEDLPYNPVYFYGDVGLGKTHLLSAVSNWAADRISFVINAADLEIEMENASSKKARTDLRRWLSSAEILLLDDIQLCEGKEDLQREIFAILNHLIRGHRWAIISSDVPPTRLAGIERRLLSRLQGGVIVGLQMPDKEERLGAIHHFLEEYPADPGVLDYLADRLTESMRRLRAIVNQLVAMGQSAGLPITLSMAQSLIEGPDLDTHKVHPLEALRLLQIPPPTTNSISNPESADHTGRSREMPKPDIDSGVVQCLKNIALLDHVGAVAAVQGQHIILHRESKLPQWQVRSAAREAARFYHRFHRTDFPGAVQVLNFGFQNGYTMLALHQADIIYVVVLTKKGKPALCLPSIKELLHA